MQFYYIKIFIYRIIEFIMFRKVLQTLLIHSISFGRTLTNW